MNALEELLSDAMSDSGGDTRSVEADWDRVTATAAVRQRRKANTYRLGVVVLIAVLGFGLFSSRLGVPVDTVANPAQPAPIVEAPELGIWPSAQDVATAAGERPQSQFWIAWLIGAGLPLLAAVTVWSRAPQHLRVPIASQRIARIVLASSAALSAAIAVGAVVCAVLFFTYDPLAAQSGTSYVLSVLGIAELSVIASVAVLSISLTQSNSDPDEGVVRRLLYGVFGFFVAFAVTNGFLGSLSLFFDWKTTEGVDGPVRGIWRLFLQGDNVYRGSSGVISEISVLLSTLIAFLLVAVALGLARVSAQNVLAGATLASARTSPDGGDAPTRAVRTVTWVLLVLAAALPIYVYVQKDVVAQSVAHIPVLPADFDRSLPTNRDFEANPVDRDFDRNVFEQLELVEITLHLNGSQTPLEEITDEQLLPERFGFVHFRDPTAERRLGEAVIAARRGTGSGGEFWSVERDESSRTITIGVSREFAMPGMNTALFIASLLILAATSTWIPKMVSKEEVEAQAIPGRRMGAWTVIATSAVIGLHLVGSLIGLAVTVGDRASRGGESIFEFYTVGGRSSPQQLLDLSPWFLLLNVFTFVPLFGLVILAVRRLTNAAKITTAMLVVTVLSPVVTFFFWGDLILQWIEWFLD